MNRTIGIFVLAALVQTALCLTSKKTFAMPHEKCIKQSNLTEKEFNELKNSQDSTSLDNVFNGNKACYILCVGQEFGMFNHDGTPNIQVLWSLASKEPLTDKDRVTSSDCTIIDEDNPCETVKYYLECMITNLV